MIKLLEHSGTINGEWFSLIWAKRGDDKRKKTLQEYIKDVDLDEYWIYKQSGKQKLVDKENLYQFSYAGYTLFRKCKYNKDHINIWIEYFNNFGGLPYMTRPLPPFDPNKIVIKK